MKKVLIISYFFPPANFVGAERTAAWAKHLHEYGYYPIVITRNWNDNQTDLTDRIVKNEYTIEKPDHYEIRRLPFHFSMRDRFATKSYLRFFQKLLTLKELILSNFRIKSLPYSNFYKEARNILKNDSEIVAVIASGRPFQSFFIGSKLKKEFPNIKWITDYRDEWTSHSRNEKNSFLQNIIQKIERRSEKKWTSNIDFFLTVSETVKNNLQKTISKDGCTILNGFDDSKNVLKHNLVKNELNIMYAGTVYFDQDFTVLLNAIESIKNKVSLSIKVHFIGVGIEKKIIDELKSKFNLEIKIIPRLDKNSLINYLTKADLLLLTSYSKTIGIYPVKIFDYFKLNIPILLVPSDHSVMEEFIKKTNSGFIVSTQEECQQLLLNLIDKKMKGESLALVRNQKYGNQFSRKHQTKKLAEILDNYFN